MKQLLLVGLTLILSACSVFDDEKTEGMAYLHQTKDIIEKEKQSSFDKNLECLKHKASLERRLKELTKEKAHDPLGWLPSLETIFYSPQFDACLYVDNVKMGKDSWAIMKRLVRLGDGLAVEPFQGLSCEYFITPKKEKLFYNETVEMYSKNYDLETSRTIAQQILQSKNCKEFDKKIKEYKK